MEILGELFIIRINTKRVQLAIDNNRISLRAHGSESITLREFGIILQKVGLVKRILFEEDTFTRKNPYRIKVIDHLSKSIDYYIDVKEGVFSKRIHLFHAMYGKLNQGIHNLWIGDLKAMIADDEKLFKLLFSPPMESETCEIIKDLTKYEFDHDPLDQWYAGCFKKAPSNAAYILRHIEGSRQNAYKSWEFSDDEIIIWENIVSLCSE